MVFKKNFFCDIYIQCQQRSIEFQIEFFQRLEQFFIMGRYKYKVDKFNSLLEKRDLSGKFSFLHKLVMAENDVNDTIIQIKNTEKKCDQLLEEAFDYFSNKDQ